MSQTSSTRGRGWSALSSWLATAAVLACVALGALIAVPAMLGYQRYVITSGSMTGTHDQGSIVFDRAVPVSDLRVGDVITYDPPAGGPRGLVTHRIVWAGRDRSGTPAFRTKGDANGAPDPWRFALHSRSQARVAFGVPYAGYALAALSVRWVRMLLIGIPALLIGLAALSGAWRQAGEEARALQAATSPVAAPPGPEG
jgi:signal peptidase